MTYELEILAQEWILDQVILITPLPILNDKDESLSVILGASAGKLYEFSYENDKLNGTSY